MKCTILKFITLLTLGIQYNPVIAQTALDSEFTYQGNLETTGSPANGQFDFRFVLFDAELDGLGSNLGQVNVENLDVVNGLFTTILNFGDASFTGNKLWMEINIRDGSSIDDHQKLLPRQQITAAPYATHAQFVKFIDADAITSAEISNNAVGSNEINSSQVQARLTQACEPGTFMQSVNQNGSVVCVSDNTGLSVVTTTEIKDATIQTVDIDDDAITGSKILNSTITSDDLASDSVGSSEIIPTQVQVRVSGVCASPLYLSGINQDGSVICERLPLGLNYVLDSADFVGRASSIAVGHDGFPIISYHDSTNGDLKIVKCVTVSCSRFFTPITLDSTGDVGRYTSIAIGNDGFPIISYYDLTNKNLKVVKCTNTSCTGLFHTITTLDSIGDVGQYNSIAIGNDGFPVISYFEDTGLSMGSLKVVKCTSASCSSFNNPIILDSNALTGRYTSIAIGNDGFPIISYHNSIAVTVGELKVTKCLNASCSGIFITVVLDNSMSDPGLDTSIAIGADGFPFIIYRNEGQTVKLVKCTNNSCSNINPPLFMGAKGSNTSIAIGNDGFPIISYSSGGLKVTKCLTVSCSSYNAPVTLDLNGSDPSIAIGSNGLPIISYRDFANFDLKVFSCADVDCRK